MELRVLKLEVVAGVLTHDKQIWSVLMLELACNLHILKAYRPEPLLA
jgi:hypothetical protein